MISNAALAVKTAFIVKLWLSRRRKTKSAEGLSVSQQTTGCQFLALSQYCLPRQPRALLCTVNDPSR